MLNDLASEAECRRNLKPGIFTISPEVFQAKNLCNTTHLNIKREIF